MFDSEVPEIILSISDFITVCNQTLDTAYGNIILEGEVASFKVNQGKWVFFDLKDDTSSVGCFIPLFNLRVPLEDGMKVRVRGTPKLTAWGKFSFTVQQIMPVGEGSIRKSFEALKAKLEKEGLFSLERKRPLPHDLTKLGVISSTGAAGYADFCKIINARWGGLDVQVCHTTVQGMSAPEQIVRALKYLNERAEVQVIAILRGGGSADDLAAFNDENLAREIAASRIPVITGIGHEVDESLADLAADIRASTPSNAAELLTRDRAEELARVKSLTSNLSAHLAGYIVQKNAEIHQLVNGISSSIFTKISHLRSITNDSVSRLQSGWAQQYKTTLEHIKSTQKILESHNPDLILAKGYAILQGKISPGNVVKITTLSQEISAEVQSVNQRKDN